VAIDLAPRLEAERWRDYYPSSVSVITWAIASHPRNPVDSGSKLSPWAPWDLRNPGVSRTSTADIYDCTSYILACILDYSLDLPRKTILDLTYHPCVSCKSTDDTTTLHLGLHPGWTTHWWLNQPSKTILALTYHPCVSCNINTGPTYLWQGPSHLHYNPVHPSTIYMSWQTSPFSMCRSATHCCVVLHSSIYTYKKSRHAANMKA
jgi:hypothetical protein